MFNIVIVDREIDSRQVLFKFLELEDDCQVIAEASSVEEAMQKLQTFNPDLLFLDVNLQASSGFELLRKIPNTDFKVVFTTSENEITILSTQFKVIGYLNKPFTPDALAVVLSKIRDKTIKENKEQLKLAKSIDTNLQLRRLIISSTKGVFYIPLNEILYLQCDGNYTTFYTEKQEKILVSKNIGAFEFLENNTPETNFFRAHQSYIINMEAVRQLTKLGDGDVIVMDDGTIIPLSRRRKELFVEKMKNLHYR